MTSQTHPRNFPTLHFLRFILWWFLILVRLTRRQTLTNNWCTSNMMSPHRLKLIRTPTSALIYNTNISTVCCTDNSGKQSHIILTHGSVVISLRNWWWDSKIVSSDFLFELPSTMEMTKCTTEVRKFRVRKSVNVWLHFHKMGLKSRLSKSKSNRSTAVNTI